MDAHIFRMAGAEIIHLLAEARIDKVFEPYPQVTIFHCYRNGNNFRLALRSDKQNPSLFFINNQLPNPPSPPAMVMRLRKYLVNTHFGEGVMNYSCRAIAFPLFRTHKQLEEYLVLDLREGATITTEIPLYFNAPAAWPNEALVRDLCNSTIPRNKEAGPWVTYPLLTPLLRETLTVLSELDGLALMVDLETGGGDVFFYADSCNKPVTYSAWPLPEKICSNRGLVALSDAFSPELFLPSADMGCSLKHLLSGISFIDSSVLQQDFGWTTRKALLSPLKQRIKRIKKTLEKFNQEEKRLNTMQSLQKNALAIQASLWQYPADFKAETVSLLDATGFDLLIILNPLLTLRQNMARMFHQADRGARGLVMLTKRKETVLKEYANLIQEDTHTGPQSTALLPKTNEYTGQGSKKRQKEEKSIARFLSADGYALFRGKNAQGNHAVIKQGQPHDYWLHAAEGPSAHLVIRRAHSNDTVPDTTLREAARLVGEKSRFGSSSKVEVMVCMLKDIQFIKGAPAGTVRVDKELSEFLLNNRLPSIQYKLSVTLS